MTKGLYVWERPALVEANRQIMAERARMASMDAKTDELARRDVLRARDIPASCICKWHFSVARDRWVLQRQHRKGRDECPWHVRASVRGGVRSSEARRQPRADLSLDDLAMTVNPALRARRDKQRAERSGKR